MGWLIQAILWGFEANWDDFVGIERDISLGEISTMNTLLDDDFGGIEVGNRLLRWFLFRIGALV
jgi:hypothetical protein